MGKHITSTKQQDTALLATSQLIINTKQARRLLGKDAKSLSDNEVAELIITLTALASAFLRRPGIANNKQEKQS